MTDLANSQVPTDTANRMRHPQTEQGKATRPLESAEENATGAVGWVKDKMAGAWKAVKSGTTTGTQKTSEGLGSMKSKVGDAFKQGRNKAVDTAHEVAEKTQEVASPIQERATQGFD